MVLINIDIECPIVCNCELLIYKAMKIPGIATGGSHDGYLIMHPNHYVSMLCSPRAIYVEIGGGQTDGGKT